MKPCTPHDIDALLPQTQCGLCGYGGCMPYAKAMAMGETAINLCPPGGVETLYALGHLLDQDVSPYLEDMQQKAKPIMLASIREAECIGCTKCIKACPVDAIIGSAKSMHVVLTDACTGCELCVPPCPVDCIDMLTITPVQSTDEQQINRNVARAHFHRRETRLQKQKEIELEKKATANIKLTDTIEQKKQERQSYILSALNRVKKYKSST